MVHVGGRCAYKIEYDCVMAYPRTATATPLAKLTIPTMLVNSCSVIEHRNMMPIETSSITSVNTILHLDTRHTMNSLGPHSGSSRDEKPMTAMTSNTTYTASIQGDFILISN